MRVCTPGVSAAGIGVPVWLEHHAVPAAIVCGFIVLCLLYASVTPMFEPPDEASHFLYIHNLIAEDALPVLVDHGAMFESQSVQRHHPPLYYLAGALLVWPLERDPAPHLRVNPFAAIGAVTANNQNVYLHPLHPDGGTALSVWTLRLFSIALGASTLVFIYRIGAAAFGRRVGASAMLLAANIPGFVALHASVNNDNLVTFLYTVGLYWLISAWGRRTIRSRDAALLALILGGIALCKINGLTLFGLVYGWLMVGALIGRFQARVVLRAIAVSLLGAGALAGWWYARNLALYGDPLALQATLAVWGRGPLPTDAGAILSEAKGVWDSFWMVFGHLNIRGADWIYGYAAALGLLGVVGCVRALGQVERAARWQIGILASAAAVVTVALWLATRQVNVSQGRILYPGMAAFALLLCVGWRSLIGRAAPLLIVPLAIAAIGAPLTVLPAAYRPPLPVAGLPAGAQPLDARAGSVSLLGGAYQPDTMSPDDAVTLDLVLRREGQSAGAGDAPDLDSAILFVKLLDPVSSVPVGGADLYPGMTTLSDLDAGMIYQVRVRFPIDRARLTGREPRQMRLLIGLRVPDALNVALETPPLQWTGADGAQLEYVIVPGPTLLDPDFEPQPPQYPASVTYGGAVQLVGYSLPALSVQPGASVPITLYWQLAQPASEDFVAAVFLQNAAGEVVAQADGPVMAYPTSAWRGTGLIADARVLAVRPDAPQGAYSLAVGWYRAADQARLTAVGDGADAAQNLFIAPVSIAVE